jgi:hypothetical protein
MILMRADLLLGKWEGSGPGSLKFLGPKILGPDLLPLAHVMDLPTSKTLRMGFINYRCINSYYISEILLLYL